jgi:aminoglycoside phosphotransferase
MSNKKYDFKVIKEEVDGASVWTAQILRRVTSSKQTVSKAQAGFATEAEALTWAQATLQEFLVLEKSKQKKSAD